MKKKPFQAKLIKQEATEYGDEDEQFEKDESEFSGAEERQALIAIRKPVSKDPIGDEIRKLEQN